MGILGTQSWGNMGSISQELPKEMGKETVASRVAPQIGEWRGFYQKPVTAHEEYRMGKSRSGLTGAKALGRGGLGPALGPAEVGRVDGPITQEALRTKAERQGSAGHDLVNTRGLPKLRSVQSLPGPLS